MRRLSLLPLLLLLALAACGPSLPPSTVNRPSSTLNGPSSTVSPTPTPSTPNEPTPDQTPAHATPNLLEDTFGLTGDALQAFSGAETYITRAEDNTYFVTAFVRDPQTLDLHPARFTLIEDTFDIHPEINNPLGLYTVRAIDENFQPVDLIWVPETQQFRLAYDLQPVVDLSTVGTERPATLLQEDLDAAPLIPVEDIQSGLAARSVLLAMERDGYHPFSQEAVDFLTHHGSGYFLYFKTNDSGLRSAHLGSYTNFGTEEQGFRPIQISPYWFKVQIGTNIYDVSALILFNPNDIQNPSPDEFLISFGIPYGGNIGRFSDIGRRPYTNDREYAINFLYLYATNPTLDPNDPDTIAIYNPQDPNQPPILLSITDPIQRTLAQLLAIPGNDISSLSWGNMYNFGIVINDEFNNYMPNNNLTIDEVLIKAHGQWVPLPDGFQSRIFLFEVGVEQ